MRRFWQLLEGDGLVSHTVDFEIDAGPDLSQCRSLTISVIPLYLLEVVTGHTVYLGDWDTMRAREFCILCSFLKWVSCTAKSKELQ